MPFIAPHSIAAVRQKVSLLEVAATYTKLTQIGRQWRGLSPLQTEKSPSFFVHPEKGLWFCHSTGKGGNVFDLVRLVDNLTFVEAVEKLARLREIPLDYDTEAQRPASGASARWEINHLARCHFAARLHSPEGAEALDYWTRVRGFDLATAVSWGIGCGGGSWELLSRLRASHGNEAVKASALFHFGPGGALKAGRFDGRLVIPVNDGQGRAAWFCGRLVPGENAGSGLALESAKYLNSPEGAGLLARSQTLFGWDKVMESHRLPEVVNLVEGALDTIRCHACGQTNTAGLMGSSPSADHFRMIRRKTRRVRFILDGDEAGRKGAFRALPLALAEGLECSYLQLPEGEDPDSYLRKGSRLSDLAGSRRREMEFAVGYLCPEGTKASPQAKARTIDEIAQMLLAVPSQAARHAFMEQAAPLLAIPSHTVLADAAKIWPATIRVARTREGAKPRHQPETVLLACLLADKSLLVPLAEATEGMTGWGDPASPATALLERITQAHRAGAGLLDDVLAGESAMAPEERSCLAKLTVCGPEVSKPREQAGDALRAILAVQKNRVLHSFTNHPKK